MTQNDDKKSKSHKPSDKLMLIRYGRMGLMGWFTHNEDQISKVNKRVIIKTDRGLELGELVGQHCYKSGNFRWNCEKVSEYYEEDEFGKVVTRQGSFERYATPEDISEERHLVASTKREIEACEKLVKELNLDMRVVDAEHLFGGERVIFYFSSEGRVDFRELVKQLAREFQTRIEMRQIGARDETKLISDFETCGQQCCCARYLKILKPVNMRMAKLQKATLDPSKISGYCGRLKCCLRYEDDLYREFKRKLPKIGSWVKTENGQGEVVKTQLLTQLVIVRGADGEKFAVGIEDVEVIPRPKRDDPGQDSDNKQSKRPENRDNRPQGQAKEQPKQEQQISKDETKPEQGKSDDAGGQDDGKKKSRRRNRGKRRGNRRGSNNGQNANNGNDSSERTSDKKE